MTIWNGFARCREVCRFHFKESTELGTVLAVGICLICAGCVRSAMKTSEDQPSRQAANEVGAEQPALELRPGASVSLFDGTSLGFWKATDFGAQGSVYVKDGAIYMEAGDPITGITWTGPVVRMNYEITLEAARVEGHDFFCALTFPFGESPCTLVLGGWNGSVCGLSSIDGYDAANNFTSQIVDFENGRWYHVRLRVVSNRIQAWLDAEELVDADTTGRNIDIRFEVTQSQPLGIATWHTTGAVRNVYLRVLPDWAS